MPSRSSLAIGLLWSLMILSAITGSVKTSPAPYPQEFSLVMAITIILMPILLFCAMSFWAPHSPFYHPTLARLIDRHFGEGTLASFLVRLKPLLLFAVGATLQSLLGISYASRTAVPAGTYVHWGFFLSGGISLALAHVILYRRKVVGVYPAGSAEELRASLAVSKPERKPLRESLRLYWKALIGVALFPSAALIGVNFLHIPFEYFILPFFVVSFLAGWPYLAGRAPYSFWLVTMVVYLLGGCVAVLLSQFARAALP